MLGFCKGSVSLCGSSKATCSMQTSFLCGYIVVWLDIKRTKSDNILYTQDNLDIFTLSINLLPYLPQCKTTVQSTHLQKGNVFIQIQDDPLKIKHLLIKYTELLI
jgi:hypothetical protein